jgi:hypothetical protein
VTQRIEHVLRDAPYAVPYALPLAYTHHELAAEVYFGGYPGAKPTTAQLAHVRRAVRALVASGKAESERPDEWERQPEPRRKGAPPVVVRRTLTDEDRQELAFHIARARQAVGEDPIISLWMDMIRAQRRLARFEGRDAGDAVQEICDNVDRGLAPEKRERNHWSKHQAEILLAAERATATERRSRSTGPARPR